MSQPLLTLREERIGYADKTVLSQVQLSLHAGEHVVVVGHSGVGKSTLISALYAHSGRQAALVPQQPGLVQTLSVFHNLYMGRLAHHSAVWNLLNLVWPQKREVAAVAPLAEALGLSEHLFQAAGQLSGGQQQRVAVGRALHRGGTLLLADEPVSAVDALQAGRILEIIREHFSTSLLALHDLDLALTHATRIIGLQGGRIVLDEPATRVSREALLFLYPQYRERGV